MADQFHPGQRWVSESEPELGLGTIVKLTARTVIAEFNAAAQKREYAKNNAPLRRVRFRAGDKVQGRTAKPLKVTSVDERQGILYYRCGRQTVCETDLSDRVTFNKPEERLFANQFDPKEAFDLRVAALQHQYRLRKSKIRGFLGGRIDLIPHQLSVASEVASRIAPRVLLADEVGLGKTIEACLILHRLILTGRAQRVLILVPDSLVHQWFVELLRRFNLWFHIYDETRCAAEGDANPFADAQLILCGISLFVSKDKSGENPGDKRIQQAVDAGWDMLVVDEAHHLRWTPNGASPEYALVERIAGTAAGLLLLTATPEQLGMAGHFARLRLLDPARFHSFDAFLRESENYRAVARQAAAMPDGPELDALLDRHGTGRVHFRNTRTTVSGFPKRLVLMHPLQNSKSKQPHIDWLVELLASVDPEKVLLICQSPQTVITIEAALRKRTRIDVGVFHEGLTLVQRDRNAAWFAEEDGARLLLCSEIGSEGRNFQFAHHLVLYDLPLDPELLEQRIGRLDRIGQTSDIRIHVAFVPGSRLEVFALWYHEGLDAFEHQLHGGRELLERFGERLQTVSTIEDLESLISETKSARKEVVKRLHEGRDRLLERNSYRPKVVEAILDEIRREDEDRTLENFMLSVFDFFSVSVEGIAERTYRLGSAGVLADSFPGLPEGGFSVTCNRNRALVREDVQFLTWDHPLVTGAIDLLLGSEKGNCSAVRSAAGGTEIKLRAVYVLECIAPPHLHADRFLPPTPIRTSIAGGVFDDLDEMLDAVQETAEAEASRIVTTARREALALYEAEATRLQELRKVNPSVRIQEIRLTVEQQRALDRCLAEARIRLDAICVE